MASGWPFPFPRPPGMPDTQDKTSQPSQESDGPQTYSLSDRLYVFLIKRYLWRHWDPLISREMLQKIEKTPDLHNRMDLNHVRAYRAQWEDAFLAGEGARLKEDLDAYNQRQPLRNSDLKLPTFTKVAVDACVTGTTFTVAYLVMRRVGRSWILRRSTPARSRATNTMTQATNQESAAVAIKDIDAASFYSGPVVNAEQRMAHLAEREMYLRGNTRG